MSKKLSILSSVVLIAIVFGFGICETMSNPKLVYANPEKSIVIQNDILPSIPVELYVPSINLDTSIIDVGITKDGKLDVPPNYTQVGWYKHGPMPGEIGSVVLDGHVDNGTHIPGPFKNLKKVNMGDEIYVRTETGRTLKYIVQGIDIYDIDKFPGELIFHDKRGPLLKIITCHGNFLKAQDTYDQRLVVTAVLVP